MMQTGRVTTLPVHTSLGESPVWDGARNLLWFVDIEAQRLHAMAWPGGRVQHWELPQAAASMALCESGRLLLALRQALFLFDPADASLLHFVDVETGEPGNRLNDGKVAPDGSFWVGSMDDAGKVRPSGALYQVRADKRVTRRVAGLVTSNGLAWSADGRAMFHSDSRGRFVKRYLYAGGELADEEVVATPSAELGRPDGAATDVQGGYWSAGVSAGCLNRYLPTRPDTRAGDSGAGDLSADLSKGWAVQRITLPVAHPTMPCFGGPDLRTLFVTSLVTDDASASGSLLCLDAGIPGVPVARFPL